MFPQSSLLSSILGELRHDKGTLKVKGQLTYVSQQPWVFPGTIQSNILFGKDLNPEKYEQVLGACALKKVRCTAWVSHLGAHTHIHTRVHYSKPSLFGYRTCSCSQMVTGH